jgi:hypothetical protein
MHTKPLFNVALLLLKLLKLYPYTRFDPRIIVRGYNFNNFKNNKPTLKSGFSVHQLVCNLI